MHAVVSELERPIGTYLYGRRMYDTMVFWETVSTSGEPAVFRDYAEPWRTADKIVYSRTLEEVSSAPDPLVDELHLLLYPIIVVGGRPALPDHVRADLEVIDERRFQEPAQL